MARPKKEKAPEPLEKQLWSAADKLRKNIDAAEYKHVVLGLIFLKYISNAFETLFAALTEGKGEYEGADPEDRDEYKAKNVFFVPPAARWSYLRDNARHPDIGSLLDKAMDAIEKENPSLTDAHKDIRADYILANPPFNDSDWSGDQLRNDARWQYGVPPVSNANFAWLQHFVFHLAPAGQAGIVLAKGALTSKSNNEGEIRRHMII